MNGIYTPRRASPLRARFIAVSGLIGAGKSTLAEGIAAHGDHQLYSEPVAENPYLADFYQDPARYAFSMQTFLLGARFRQHQQIVWSGEPAVQDRSIYEDTVFAALQAQDGTMSRRDYETYLSLFSQMAHFLQRPDVVLYLDVTPEQALERVRARARSAEAGLPLAYLERLHAAYEEWYERMREPLRIVRVPWASYQTVREVLALAERHAVPQGSPDRWALDGVLTVGAAHA